jgi:hypothetical protein
MGGMRGWLSDLVVGGLIGGLVGVIATVNFVIYTGIEQGYEASLVEVFQYSPVAGIVTVMILLAGPPFSECAQPDDCVESGVGAAKVRPGGDEQNRHWWLEAPGASSCHCPVGRELRLRR